MGLSLHEKNMSVESSKTIATKLADYDECGFEQCRTRDYKRKQTRDNVYDMVLDRLAFIADMTEVPHHVCTAAARCGGLPPYPDRLPNIEQTPMLADVDDATYGCLLYTSDAADEEDTKMSVQSSKFIAEKLADYDDWIQENADV